MSLILMDWDFGSEIRRVFDFLKSLCNCLDGLYTLFMKDFTVRGRSSWLFQFFQSVVSSIDPASWPLKADEMDS
jgi:hypothetical protein